MRRRVDRDAGGTPETGDASSSRRSADYTQSRPAGLRGARVGWPGPSSSYSDASTGWPKKPGGFQREARCSSPADVPHVGEYYDAELEVLLYESKRISRAIWQSWGSGPGQNLEDVIEFNEHIASGDALLGQELFLQAREGPLTHQRTGSPSEVSALVSRAGDRLA